MLAVEKLKQPKIIRYVWWDGFNKEKVKEVFPTVTFSKFSALDEDPWCVRIVYDGNRVRDIEHGFYLCCERGDSVQDIFVLSKKEFEEKYNSLSEE